MLRTTHFHRRRALLAGVLAWASAGNAQAQKTITLAPRGEHAQIDVQLTNDTMRQLLGADEAERQHAARQVQSAPQRYAPPVFYALSAALMQLQQPERAMFWFYAGQLRGRFDANRCADISARQAIAVLNERFGTPINQYAFKRLPLLEKTVAEVIDWDRKTPHDYDHRWINLHGMGAFGTQGDAALSLPKAEWDAIAEQTRRDYLAAFKTVLQQMRSGKFGRTPER